MRAHRFHGLSLLGKPSGLFFQSIANATADSRNASILPFSHPFAPGPYGEDGLSFSFLTSSARSSASATRNATKLSSLKNCQRLLSRFGLLLSLRWISWPRKMAPGSLPLERSEKPEETSWWRMGKCQPIPMGHFHENWSPPWWPPWWLFTPGKTCRGDEKRSSGNPLSGQHLPGKVGHGTRFVREHAF